MARRALMAVAVGLVLAVQAGGASAGTVCRSIGIAGFEAQARHAAAGGFACI